MLTDTDDQVQPAGLQALLPLLQPGVGGAGVGVRLPAPAQTAQAQRAHSQGEMELIREKNFLHISHSLSFYFYP